MNSAILKALDQTKTGNLIDYFSSMDGIIEANSGIHDNKYLSIDAYDPPAPVNKGIYTKVKLTDESIDVVSIDKSNLIARVEVTMNETQGLSNDLMTEYNNATPETRSKIVLRNKMTQFFVGLKSSNQLFDGYRIYSNGKKTRCEQTEALYETALDRMLKSQEEMDEKPNIFSTWEKVDEGSECICGTYFDLEDIRIGRNDEGDAITPGKCTMVFYVNIPLDHFLPLNAFTMFPSCVFGNLTMEIKMAIQNNFVVAQCDFNKCSENYASWGMAKESSIAFNAMYDLINKAHDAPKMNMRTKAFTQIGDPFKIAYISLTGDVITKDVSFTISGGRMLDLRSNLNGFNIKDSVKETLRGNYSGRDLIIPAQYIDYQAFSQAPKYGTTRCNNTYTLTNCSAIGLLFPRTQNEVTISRNPDMAQIQLQVDNKPYPDKPFSTHSVEHTNYVLTNAGFDGIFSANKELSNSIRFNDMGYHPKYDGEVDIVGASPSADNTSYTFYVSTERLGYGVFCDGLSKESAQVSLMMSSEGTQSTNPNPYVEGKFSPIMLVVQDCFWKCNTSGCEFVYNDPSFVEGNRPMN